MTDAVLRCPGCGAPSPADAACCEYCGSALATVTCASCYAAMFAGSRFCAHCGAEAAPAMVDEGLPLPCPRCDEPMHAVRLGGAQARECERCGGLWMEPDVLQHLLGASAERSAVGSALIARVPPGTAQPDVVRYLPCPRCHKLMNRMNFAQTSGVVLDSCKTHGVWLDRNELRRIIAFIEGGGIAIASEREADRLAAEARRLAVIGGNTRDIGAMHTPLVALRAQRGLELPSMPPVLHSVDAALANFSESTTAKTLAWVIIDLLGLAFMSR